MKKLQIGIIGSMADMKIQNRIKHLARDIGKEIARNNAVLVFGLEGDFESLSSIAAHNAEIAGGQTLAFVHGCKREHVSDFASLQVVTGQERGGGREFSFILSCDAIICINGGSGTLMEIAMAYQAGIPIVALKGSLGWSDKLIDSFLDERKREKICSADTAENSVRIAIKLANNNLNQR